MTEVFRKYGGGEPRPDDKAPIACTVRHPEAGGQCEREAIGEVWSLPFCEVHGKEAEMAYMEEYEETIGYGLDMLRDEELLKDLELIRERATVQQLLADRDLERRWAAPRREANRSA